MSMCISKTCLEKTNFEVENDDGRLSTVECLRLKNSLVEILEELKLRRTNDKEYEQKIKKAAEEKYDLNRKYEGEILRLNEAREKYQKQIHDAERKYKEKLSQLEDQLKQQMVFKSCTEKEINILKEEIRNLEVVKYTLEKDLKEQERKLQLYVQSSEQHLNQLTETDKKFKAIQLQCKQLGEALVQVEDSVQHAVKHNQALMYINEHQKCILNEEKNRVLSLQAQLLEVKCRLQQKPDETSLQQYKLEIASLNQKLEKVNAERETALKEINEHAAKNEKVSKLLQDTHQLMEHQIEIVEIHKRNSSQQKLVISQQQEELDQVKGELLEVKDNIALLKDQHKEDAEEWRKKNLHLQDELSKIMEELAEEKKSCADLGDLNTALSNQNIQLTEQLQSTKELLNKVKQDQDQQTELSLMNMVEQESQVEVNSADTAVQTDSVPPKSSSTQTPAPELTVSRTQTNNPALANSSCQTERVWVQSVSVQAEIIKYNSKERLFCQSLSSASSVWRSLSQETPAEGQTGSENYCQSTIQPTPMSGTNSQPLQELSVCDNCPNTQFLSNDSHQIVVTDICQPPDPDSQSPVEYPDRTTAVNSAVTPVTTEHQATVPDDEPVSNNIQMDVSSHRVEPSNDNQRKTFQLPENTSKTKEITEREVCVQSSQENSTVMVSKREQLLSQENLVLHKATEDGPSLMDDNALSAASLNLLEMTPPGLGDVLKTQPEIKAKETIGIDVNDVTNPAPVVQNQADSEEVCKAKDKPDRSDDQPSNSTDLSSDPGKTCVSPRSPGGSRLRLSLSRLKTSKTAQPGPSFNTAEHQAPLQTVDQVHSPINSTSPMKQKEETSQLNLELKDMKGILRGSGQEGLLKRKQVTFGSPLQDVHQISQTSVESVSYNDGDKELFSDSDEDTENGSSKGGRHFSVSCLSSTSTTTTLIIHGKKMESTNSLANCVDKFLPETSLTKSISSAAVAVDGDNIDEDFSSNNSVINEKQITKVNNSASTPLSTGGDMGKVLPGDKTGVSVPTRMFRALEIPKVPEMTLSTASLSNQYKRTIDAILNKGKKRKTDK
uniref:Coiled-coil domain-containing protein 73-like isoform X2 n=1 Tax=Crassostrea virginica TaxID=6565 RepID=A0A8B8DMJ0_CRAVI|nr:coiled-coil domain-containing protein 73-like isoform X2 [Crassostrea virginica]